MNVAHRIHVRGGKVFFGKAIGDAGGRSIIIFDR